MSELDGYWDVRRTAGALPPLGGVRKRIAGNEGWTEVGSVRVAFRVEGRRLQYTGLLRGLVDELEPDAEGFAGRATLAGREYGRFVLRRVPDTEAAVSTPPQAPALAWTDLTVPDAEPIRDYYAAVVGWSFEPHDMGDYADFSMTTGSGERVAGICFARGVNADVPPVWIPYFAVGDLEAAVARAVELGGEIVSGPRAGFCIVRDPAGAVAAFYQQS